MKTRKVRRVKASRHFGTDTLKPNATAATRVSRGNACQCRSTELVEAPSATPAISAGPSSPSRRAQTPPLIKAWPERATADRTIISEWWATWPDANIGLHCVGLLVLDVDPRHDGPASLEVCSIPIVGSRRPRCSAPQAAAGTTSTGALHQSPILRAN